jgi:hypothetical protein
MEQRRQHFAREVARVQTAGEPTTPEELLAMYRGLLATDDATEAWSIAFTASEKAFPGPEVQLKDSPPPPRPGEPWVNLPDVAAYFDQHADVMRKIEAAVDTPGDCRFLTSFNWGMSIGHVDGLRRIHVVLINRAHLRAHRGDSAGAMKNLLALLRVPETMRLEPVFSTQLIRRFRLREDLEVLENLLSVDLFTEEQLAELQMHLSDIDLHPSMALVVMGERVAGLRALEDPAEAGAASVPALVHQTWTGEDGGEFLEMMQKFEEAVQTEWPEPLRRTAGYHGMTVDDAMVSGPLGRGQWFSPTKMGGALRHNLIVHTAVATARLRAAVAGLAALRFRQASGRWPRTLGELQPTCLPAVPLDPFTGGPLQLKGTTTGFMVYSVGIDGQDGGGVEKAEPTPGNRSSWRQGNPDVVFELKE